MGRGSSKVGGKYTSPEEFERKLENGSGFNDQDYSKFESAYSEGLSYNRGLEKNIANMIDEDGDLTDAKTILDSEERMTRRELADLPKNKTAEQIGEEMALNERLDVIEKLRNRKPRARKDIDIVVDNRR